MKCSVMSNKDQPMFDVKAEESKTPSKLTPKVAFILEQWVASMMFVMNPSRKAKAWLIPVTKRKIRNRMYQNTLSSRSATEGKAIKA
jgi:hypothetical protein